jgi:hypothetical protein
MGLNNINNNSTSNIINIDLNGADTLRDINLRSSKIYLTNASNLKYIHNVTCEALEIGQIQSNQTIKITSSKIDNLYNVDAPNSELIFNSTPINIMSINVKNIFIMLSTGKPNFKDVTCDQFEIDHASFTPGKFENVTCNTLAFNDLTNRTINEINNIVLNGGLIYKTLLD